MVCAAGAMAVSGSSGANLRRSVWFRGCGGGNRGHAIACPRLRCEPWCELALLCYRQARWEECFAYATRALRITNREAVYTCDPEVWGHQAHDLAAISAWNLGLRDTAIKQGQIAVDLAPHDGRLRSNLAYYLGETQEEAA